MKSLPKQLVKPTQVLLHVYDLGKHMQVVNSVSRVFDWGIFHVGVEVYGKEWCFERVFSIGVPGIFAYTPKQHPSHVYRESVLLGETQLTQQQVRDLLRKLSKEWPGTSYHLLRRNCITFAEKLSKCLGVTGVPKWVRKAPEQGLRILEDRLHLETIAAFDDYQMAEEHCPRRRCVEKRSVFQEPAELHESSDDKHDERLGVISGGAFPHLRAMPSRPFRSGGASPSSSSQYACELVDAPLYSILERTEPPNPPMQVMQLQSPLTEKLKSINRAQRKKEFLTLMFGPQKESSDSQSSGTPTRIISSGSGYTSPNPPRQIGTPSKSPWSALLGGSDDYTGDATPSTTVDAGESPITPSAGPPAPATIRKLSSASAPGSPGASFLGIFPCCARWSPVSSPHMPSPIVSTVNVGQGPPSNANDDKRSVGLDNLDVEIMRSVSFRQDR